MDLPREAASSVETKLFATLNLTQTKQLTLQSADLPQFDENTYELAYNSGSSLAMRGKYNEALPTLKRAEQASFESVIEDGGTEEEAKEEAAIIR